MYGRFGKSSRSWGSGRPRASRKPYRNLLKVDSGKYRKGVKSFKPKFATVGFSRDVEKKFVDKALYGAGATSAATGIGNVNGSNGRMWSSTTWTGYDFNTPPTTSNNVTNDLLKNVPQGTTASARIGNKINVRYVKGSITLTSASLQGPSTGATNGDMNGESVATAFDAAAVVQYLRTTWRIVTVMDNQVNSTDANINYSDVFETGSNAVGETGGVHAELKIANMGRFRVLSDMMMTTNAVNPQETIRFMVPGSKIGSVRYNGPGSDAYTDKGIYIVWAAYVSGTIVDEGVNGLQRPVLTMNSRLAFTDE